MKKRILALHLISIEGRKFAGQKSKSNEFWFDFFDDYELIISSASEEGETYFEKLLFEFCDKYKLESVRNRYKASDL